MSFLDNVERIRAELLGADRDTPAAQVVAAALPLMGIVPEPSWALPQMVDAIHTAMTCNVTGAAEPAATRTVRGCCWRRWSRGWSRWRRRPSSECR